MTDKATITVGDSVATPVAGTPGAIPRSYLPEDYRNGVHSWRSTHTGSTPDLAAYFTASISRPTAQRPTEKRIVILRVPSPQTVDGTTVSHHVDMAKIEITVHKDASYDEQNDLIAMFVNGVSGNTQLFSLLANGEPIS